MARRESTRPPRKGSLSPCGFGCVQLIHTFASSGSHLSGIMAHCYPFQARQPSGIYSSFSEAT
eukprot:6382474-Amphidinium_carterae.1